MRVELAQAQIRTTRGAPRAGQLLGASPPRVSPSARAAWTIFPSVPSLDDVQQACQPHRLFARARWRSNVAGRWPTWAATRRLMCGPAWA